MSSLGTTASLFINLDALCDFTMLATARWPFNRWRQTGRRRDPMLYVYGGSAIDRSCGATSRSSGGGKLHYLSHNSGLRLPPKTGGLDRERQPGIEHFVSPS